MKLLIELKIVMQDAVKLILLTWQHYRVLILKCALVVLSVSILPFVQNFYFGVLIDELVSDTKGSAIYIVLCLLCVVGACFALANICQFYFKGILYKELFWKLSLIIHERMAKLDLQTHENPARKDLLNKVLEHAMWRAPDFMQRMLFLVQNALECVFATAVFMLADWRMGVLIFVSTLPRLLIELYYNDELWQAETAVSERRRKFWYARWHIIDLRPLTEVKLFQNVDYFVSRMNEHLGFIKDKEVAIEGKNVRRQIVAMLLSEGVNIFVIWVLVRRVILGDLQVGQLSFYLASLGAYRFALASLAQNLGSQFQDGKYVRDMFQAFSLKPILEIDIAEHAVRIERIDQIEFQDVWFHYPGSETMILKGISFSLKPGKTIALLAENGSGKSTLTKLLCRQYDPVKGRILVNGIDLKKLDVEHWRSLIGIMMQEFSHYEHLSVAEAVMLGDTAVKSKERLEESLGAADASQFVEELPYKSDTILGRYFEGGVELSGGQYQKLGIARIFYRKPQVAIFDEPTSAIDGEAEARIFEHIFGKLPKCSKLLISHRFYTIKKADEILLIADGKIKERGAHESLMQHDGVYAMRYMQQAAEYQ